MKGIISTGSVSVPQPTKIHIHISQTNSRQQHVEHSLEK